MYERITRWWGTEGQKWSVPPKGNVVYARFELHRGMLYIGETGEWLKRQHQHTYQTFRHSIGCQQFHSNSPFMQKRATLAACLRKVHGMASDARMRYTSGLAKVAEFRRLRYPLYVLCKTCAYLGASTGDSTWIQIRDYLRHTG